MARVDCERESDVLTMVATGQWPERAPSDLREHVEACAVCAELALAASAIDAEAASRRVPDLPSAGTVWWRAQLRARQEAARDVVRPITFVQAVALAMFAGVGGAVFGATASWFQKALGLLGRAFSQVASSIRLPSVSLPDDFSTVWAGYWVIVVVVGVCLVAAAAVMGWAIKEDA